MLLVGIPVIIYMSRWLLIKILANFNLSLADWFCRPYFSCGPDYVPSFFSIWLPLLLGFLYYFHVRRIRRNTLSLLWAYAIVFTAYGTASSLLLEGMDPEWRFRAPWTWWNEGQTFIHLIRTVILQMLLGFLCQSAAYDGIPCLCFGPMRLFSLHTGQPVRCFWKGWILNGGSELRGRGGTKARRSYI